jgi:hypothetical protein
MEDLSTVFALPVTTSRLATAQCGYQTSHRPCRFHWPISSSTMNLLGPGVCYEITSMYNVYSSPVLGMPTSISSDYSMYRTSTWTWMLSRPLQRCCQLLMDNSSNTQERANTRLPSQCAPVRSGPSVTHAIYTVNSKQEVWRCCSTRTRTCEQRGLPARVHPLISIESIR